MNGWDMDMNKYAALAFLLITSFANAEDVTDAFGKCAITENDQRRLACYDKIRDEIVKNNTPSKTATSKYPNIDMADLKVDIEKLNGRRFSVAGYVQSFAGSNFLKSDSMDANPIILDVDGLPRDDRKKLINECQRETCLGVFYGVVKKSDFMTVFKLEKVDWKVKGQQ